MYNKILEYWFNGSYKNNLKRWFMEGYKYDKEIKKIFYNILKNYKKYKNWHLNKDSYLAYIILLDQFSRQIYRNNSKAFKYDKIILRFMKKYLSKYIESFNAIEKMFVLMPLQHSPNIKDQKKGLKLLKHLISKEQNSKEKKILQLAYKHQYGHYKIIKKFNRFPKRNKALNRKSTNEENIYLQINNKLSY